MAVFQALVPLFLLAVHLSTTLGAPDGKIIGGENARPGEHPYTVSLQINGWHFCGGSILTKKTILTATHCIGGDPKRYSVYAGSINTQSGGVLYWVDDYVLNPKYDEDRFIHDTAVMYVIGEIQFTPNIQPIGLGFDYIGEGEDVVIAGWGMTSYPTSRTDIQQVIGLKTISHDLCQSRYDQINFPIDHSILCTYTKFGEGICFGDSGSAIVHDGKAVGIAAMVMPCAIGYPDGFARISADRDWLNSVLK